MKSLKNFGKYEKLFILAILLLLPTIYSLHSSISRQKILREKPSEIIIANISTVQAQIYWKANPETIQTLSYKEARDTGLYKNAPQAIVPKDLLTEKRVHYATLSNLKPNTEYKFRIETESKIWGEELSFKTKPIAEEVELPNIVTGQEGDRSLVLIDIDGDKHLLDTQYHGTWVLDTKGEEYSVATYANYTTQTELREKLFALIPSPLYAQSGANCKTGIQMNTSTSPSKSKVTDILNRWVQSCPKGGYPDECYEDVYCRALKYGIDPAFAFSIWSNESGGSNYAYRSSIGDFGIHDIPSAAPMSDFDKQIEFFLQRIAQTSYIENCQWDNTFHGARSELSKEIIMWGAKFLTGKCTAKEHFERGYSYMTQINQIYGWYTNKSLSWPFRVAVQPYACNYSRATTNTTYNTCNSKGTPNPDPDPDPEPNPPTTRKWLDITGIGNDGKRISPEVDKECKDFGWNTYCTCIWNYNIKPGEYTKDAQIGQTCTVDGRVINSDPEPDPEPDPDPDPEPEPEPEPEACCLYNNTVEFLEEPECKGTILEDITERNCKETTTRINIQEGVNFLEAQLVINSNDVPISTAKEIIEYAEENIIAVGLFRNDRWEKIVKYENDTISGNDFNLEPSEVYMLIAIKDTEIVFDTIEIPIEVEIRKLTGWNLVPTSQFKNTSTSTRILLNTEYSYIKQIAMWNNEQNIFDYTLRDNSGEVYGDSIPLSRQRGLFVKIP
jgi:hypothetical protein